MNPARLPRNATFLRTTPQGESIYMTRDGIVTKVVRKPPWHTIILINPTVEITCPDCGSRGTHTCAITKIDTTVVSNGETTSHSQ